MYALEFTKQALIDIARLKKFEPRLMRKIESLLVELTAHPLTGIGKPELLKHDYAACYSRRISAKHRLIYQIKENEVVVAVLSAYGHYDDK